MEWTSFIYGGICGFVGGIACVVVLAALGAVGMGYWEE